MTGSELTWTCSVCEKIHRGLPAIAFNAPEHYYGIQAEERPRRTELNEDFCLIDGDAFYIRSVLEVPISGRNETLEWGVWSSLSEAHFLRYKEAFLDMDQSKLGPMCKYPPAKPGAL
jgi:hypothetical protein